MQTSNGPFAGQWPETPFGELPDEIYIRRTVDTQKDRVHFGLGMALPEMLVVQGVCDLAETLRWNISTPEGKLAKEALVTLNDGRKIKATFESQREFLPQGMSGNFHDLWEVEEKYRPQIEIEYRVRLCWVSEETVAKVEVA